MFQIYFSHFLDLDGILIIFEFQVSFGHLENNKTDLNQAKDTA